MNLSGVFYVPNFRAIVGRAARLWCWTWGLLVVCSVLSLPVYLMGFLTPDQLNSCLDFISGVVGIAFVFQMGMFTRDCIDARSAALCHVCVDRVAGSMSMWRKAWREHLLCDDCKEGFQESQEPR